MKYLRFITLCFLGCLFCANAFSQNCEVKNVSFRQEGRQYMIQYDLIGNPGKYHHVTLSLSDDGGQTYQIIPNTLFGDIGDYVKPGTKKEILWFYTNDIPNGLDENQLVFDVNAELKKGGKFPYLLVGAGAVGGVVYFLSQSPQSEPNGKGSIKIHLSDF